MEVQLETQHVNLPTNSVRSLVSRAVRVLNRLGASILRVHILLRTDSSKSKTAHKVCVIRAELIGGGQVLVVDRKRRMAAAIMSGLRRVKMLVAEESRLRRTRERRNATRARFEPAAA